MAREARERSFDELAKGLAEGTISRRRALKLFAGSAIAALIPSRALAGGHGHGHGKPEKCTDPCICHRPPGNPNNAQTLCIPKKAREAHLKNHSLDTCGPCSGTTTSTTTPTSSTTSSTTSTTSTSTTPMCMPLGGSCATNNQCCSGRCDVGTCAEACPSGKDTLSNGTCATPCPNGTECPGIPCSCTFTSEGNYCGTSGSGNACDVDGPYLCGSGEMCAVGLCFAAC